MQRDSRQVLTELLVFRAQAGDEAAFRSLHGLWQQDLKRFAQSLAGEVGAAEEIAQDAWLAIARTLGRLDDPACFPRWAFCIVRRRSADWIRRRVRERGKITQLQGDVGATAEPANPRLSDESAALAECLAELLPAERQLLGLFYEHGRSVAEIAEILAVPCGTVKSRLFTLRERLKTKLETSSP